MNGEWWFFSFLRLSINLWQITAIYCAGYSHFFCSHALIKIKIFLRHLVEMENNAIFFSFCYLLIPASVSCTIIIVKIHLGLCLMNEGGNQTVHQYCQLFPLTITYTSSVLQRWLTKKKTCCTVIQHTGKSRFLVKIPFLKPEENYLLCMVRWIEQIKRWTRLLFFQKREDLFSFLLYDFYETFKICF